MPKTSWGARLAGSIGSLGMLVLLSACERDRPPNSYNPQPVIGIGKTLPVGLRGTEPCGAYDRNVACGERSVTAAAK